MATDFKVDEMYKELEVDIDNNMDEASEYFFYNKKKQRLLRVTIWAGDNAKEILHELGCDDDE